MLVISQNQLRIVDVNELIIEILGSPNSQEVKIKPLDSNLALATYYSKDEGLKVLQDFIAAKRNLYKIEQAKELLSPEEIKKIIDNDYLFQFPEEKYVPRNLGE